IACLNRPAKGNMLFKKIKSHPLHIQSALSVSMSEPIQFVSSEIEEIKGSEIPKMSSAQTFSSAMADRGFVQWLQPIRRLEEGSWPNETVSAAKDEPKQISLFGDDQ
ncbi:MAG: hypothetical protein HUJ54_14775, partial [Erysipelotrichaceae bacterium]|nr:hypothetical protein [Erysipelotrichaceae bacterium]